MKPANAIIIAILGFVILLVQCKKDDDDPIECPPTPKGTEVCADFSQGPFDKLSDYQFFIGDMAEQEPNEGVLPYDVITPLFSDYAHKKRFIWMPEGVSATYDGDHNVLDMPDGTVIIKTFYYDNVQPADVTRIIETRLLFKVNGEWEFADYVWNEEQTEAFFDLDGSYTEFEFVDENQGLLSVDYRIPSDVECVTCHKIDNNPIPIGPKPQNLNMNYTYSDGEMNQLTKWMEVGYLDNSLPGTIETVADWTDTSLPKLDRVRAYVDMNCAHCHRDESHCNYRPMRFEWNETAISENLGVCVEPADPIDPLQLYVVAPGNISKSMLYFRLDTTEPSERMPLMGRTLIHQESIELMEEWINELDVICE